MRSTNTVTYLQLVCIAAEKLSAVHLLLDTFGGSRTVSNTSTTNYTQISSFSFDHSGQIVSAAFQVSSKHIHVNSFFDVFMIPFVSCLQCFDAVGWVAGRASGL